MANKTMANYRGMLVLFTFPWAYFGYSFPNKFPLGLHITNINCNSSIVINNPSLSQ